MTDLSETGTLFEKYVYVTVICSLRNLIMSDLKPNNIKNKMYTLGSDGMQVVKETEEI